RATAATALTAASTRSNRRADPVWFHRDIAFLNPAEAIGLTLAALTSQGNTEGTPARAHATTRDHSLSRDSSGSPDFRILRLPRLPALPDWLLDGKEGVDGSSPSEGLQKRSKRRFYFLSYLHKGSPCARHGAVHGAPRLTGRVDSESKARIELAIGGPARS